MLVFLEIINKIVNSVDYVLTYSYTHKNQRKRSTPNKRATINAILVYEYLWLIQRPWTLCSLVKFMYCCFIYVFSVCCSSSSYFPVAPREKKASKWATIIYDFNGARNIKLERLKRKIESESKCKFWIRPRKWTNNANWVLALITFM